MQIWMNCVTESTASVRRCRRGSAVYISRPLTERCGRRISSSSCLIAATRGLLSGAAAGREPERLGGMVLLVPLPVSSS